MQQTLPEAPATNGAEKPETPSAPVATAKPTPPKKPLTKLVALSRIERTLAALPPDEREPVMAYFITSFEQAKRKAAAEQSACRHPSC